MRQPIRFSPVRSLLAVGISTAYLVSCSGASEESTASASNISRRSEGAISSDADGSSCEGEDCCTGESCPVCADASSDSASIKGRGAFTEQNGFADGLAGDGATTLSWSSNARDSASAPTCCFARWLCSPDATDLRNSCLVSHPSGSFSCGAVNYNPCYSLGLGFYGVSCWRVCTCTWTVP
jgi:hypothetical protein